MCILIAFLLIFPWVANLAFAENAFPEQIHQTIAQGKVHGERIHDSSMVLKFYRDRDFRPLWTQQQASEMIQSLSEADHHGLDAHDYHSSVIDSIQEQLAVETDATGKSAADLDVLLTDSFFQLSHDLANGRTPPPQHWKIPFHRPWGPALLKLMDSQSNPEELLSNSAPQTPEYAALMEALLSYRKMASEGGWPEIYGGEKLSLGDSDDRVAAIRSRLAATGELSTTPQDPLLFNGDLEYAIRLFQESHGLQIDGRVGPETLDELNIPVTARIRQMEINLERMRWISTGPGARYVSINIPDFRLTVVDSGRRVLEMRVIAGKMGWSSPVFFNSEIIKLELNPAWYVPQDIAEEEIEPLLQKDPDYLKKNGLAWVQVSDGTFTLRQSSGAHNSLGRIKFIFPNDWGVYLHGTPLQGLFDVAMRALSHGCIRLENVFDLADYLLSGNPKWAPDKLLAASEAGTHATIALQKPIPLYFVYLTAFVNETGEIQFRRDIYELDSALSRKLQ